MAGNASLLLNIFFTPKSNNKRIYLRKLHDIYILHQFSYDHNWKPKISSNMKRIAYISSSITRKN